MHFLTFVAPLAILCATTNVLAAPVSLPNAENNGLVRVRAAAEAGKRGDVRPDYIYTQKRDNKEAVGTAYIYTQKRGKEEAVGPDYIYTQKRAPGWWRPVNGDIGERGIEESES